MAFASRLRPWVQSLDWALPGLLAVLAATRALRPESYQAELAKAAVVTIQRNDFWIAVAFATLVFVAKSGLSLLDQVDKDRGGMKVVLDSVHQIFFTDLKPESRMQHRITVFRAG